MDDLTQAAQTIGRFLQAFTSAGALRLRFRVKVRGVKSGDANNGESSEGSDAQFAGPAESAGKDRSRGLYVEFTGPDTPVLTARNGDVLNALEHIAAQILRLEPEEQDRVSFDADQFKANRDRQMRESAAVAVDSVRATGRPHAFPSMTSRERRMLHMILKDSGLPTASSGEGPGRFVVLYPQGANTSVPLVTSANVNEQPQRRHDSSRVRETFRHR